jgi:flagellar hook-length control protein FliK
MPAPDASTAPRPVNPVPTGIGLASRESGPTTRAPGSGGAPLAVETPRVVRAVPGLELQLALKAREYLAKGRTEVRVSLDPPSLGKLKIKLEIEDARAVARIVASSPETAALLAKDREELVRAFQNQGFDRVEVQVEADTESAARSRSDRDGKDDGAAPRGEESPASDSARNPRRAKTSQSTAARPGLDLFV